MGGEEGEGERENEEGRGREGRQENESKYHNYISRNLKETIFADRPNVTLSQNRLWKSVDVSIRM